MAVDIVKILFIVFIGLFLLRKPVAAQDIDISPATQSVYYKYVIANTARVVWESNGRPFKTVPGSFENEWKLPDSLHLDQSYGCGFFYYTLNNEGKILSVRLLTLEIYTREMDRISDWLVFAEKFPSGNVHLGIPLDSADNYIYRDKSRIIARYLLKKQAESHITFQKVDFSQEEPRIRNFKRKNEFFLPFYFNTTLKEYKERSKKNLQKIIEYREKQKYP